MKTGQIIQLITGLNSLDTYTAVTATGEKIEVPYDFSAKLRFNIAKNIVLAARVNATFNKNRRAIIDEYADVAGGGLEENHPKRAEALERINALAEEDAEAGLLKLPHADLLRDDQPVPASVIAILLPIISDPVSEESAISSP